MGTHLTQVRRDRLKNLKPGTTLVVHVRKPNEDAVQDIYVGGLVRQLIAPGKGTPDRPGVVIDRHGVEISVPYDQIRFAYRSN